MAEANLQIEYMPLSELVGKMHPQNPKGHDIGQIIESYKAHGYVASGVLDARTGLMLAGHGRIEALSMMKKNNTPAPDGIRNGGDDWFVPVQTGYASKNDMQAKAYLVADNRLTTLGGWDESALAELLQELANSDEIGIEASAYDGDDLDNLLRDLGQVDEPDDNYSRKIEAPTYEPSGDKPPVSILFDDSRTKQLVSDIEAYEGLSDDEKEFLIIAAQRHTILDFGKIADFYSHADKGLQSIMEDSALVIIDFNKAIELGFVKLTENIASMVGEEYNG